MSAKRPRLVTGIIGAVFSLLIFGFAGWLLLNRQYAIDQVSVWAYDRPTDVASLEERIDLTQTGSFYFHASQPVISDAEAFNQQCPRQEVGSPILGCYAMGRIYIYDVTNEQLNGIEEVTAAHEMLHAVWQRMAPEEQSRIASLLRTAYDQLASSELKDRMSYYERTEPGQFENELHSILGTEVAGLPSELEAYYARFFDDRSKVIAFHSQYSGVFIGLSERADALYAELTELATSVQTRSDQYNADVAQLSRDIESFNRRANSGEFDSMDQFNQERNSLISRSNRLEAERSAINNDIDTYNQKYAEYEDVAAQIEILNDSIDSINDLQPAPSI
jgi:hypothetical protein